MKVLLIDRAHMFKYDLPEKIEDSFVITYKPIGGKECTIALEAENGVWKLKSSGSVNIINNSMLVAEAELISYNGYVLKFLGLDNFVILYAMPTVEEECYKLDFSELDKITIGNNANCNICYNNSSVNPLHATMTRTGDGWVICPCSDLNFQTFVNNELLGKPKKLYVGDVIFINGFKVIWMQSFLQINNPNKQVTVAGLRAHTQLQTLHNNEYIPVSDEEQHVDLYNEEDYFFHIPRIKEFVEVAEIKIDPPPASSTEDEMPFLLTLGTSLTMGASTLMMAMNVAYSISAGNRPLMLIIPQVIMIVAMVFGSIIMPKVMKNYQKKKKKEREQLRQRKYTEYLAKKDQDIAITIKKQAQIMRDNSVSIPNCSVIIASNNRFFWGRTISDDDFLSVRLGTGNLPAPVKISAPEEQFTLDEDNLLEMVFQIVEKHKMVEEVPIAVSLLDRKITSLICECSYKDKYVDSMILQLIALHSSTDLKIVIFTDKSKEKRWEHMRMLPHCWSDDRATCFFATNNEETKELSSFLEDELKKRKIEIEDRGTRSGKEGEEKVDKNDIYKNFGTYYLIINDNYRVAKYVPFINMLFSMQENFGFSYMVIEGSMRNVPINSEVFIQLGETEGAILEKNINASAQIRFRNEYDPNLNLREVINKIANIPTVTKEGLSILPTSLSFLEMFSVSKIEQLNVVNRWKVNSPVTTLSAPVGVHANGDQFRLDLHEKFHGPHGLIAGMTGSGKSEFIISYILSMAINYHPYEVQFVLIDYKGGGLAGAFENKETGVGIPHLAGTITNLDTAEMNRTLVSIESELKRRQRVFNEVRDALGESTIDIYKYQRLYREGQVEKPMSHLFIISDEFAELKSQQPDFMAQLISTARIGRSLGVHLILATQKPSGVVNDQIWSNSKFKVCLRVQDRSDSMEMLKKPDAASLKEAGRFFLQVGYDEFFDIGQSGWAGAKYVPSDRIIKKIDDSIDFVNNVGYPIKSIKDVIKSDAEEKDYGDQLTNIVKYIHNVSNREQLVTNKLWLDAIPEEIFISNLKTKYQYKASSYLINPIIGELDSPASQSQDLLCLNLTNGGNAVIVGQSGSGKEHLLTTMIWSSIVDHTPEEVNFYIMDYGSESLKIFNGMPHVGEVSSVENVERTVDILKMLNEEIDRRKALMSDYAGSYIEYLEHSGKKLPLIVAIINNYEVFLEHHNRLEENLIGLYRDGSKYGVNFIITAISPSTIRQRILQYFNNKLCLQLPNDDDYRSHFSVPRGLFPSRIFGRGLAIFQDSSFEFQTASFAERKNINATVREAAKTYNQAYTSKAKKIPSIPKYVTVNLFDDLVSGLKIPIGYDITTKEPLYYDFMANNFNMIAANAMDATKMSFVYSILQLFQQDDNAKIRVVDLVGVYEEKIANIVCYKDDFDKHIVEINNEIMKEKESSNRSVYLFLGVGEYKTKFSSYAKQIFNTLCENLNTVENTCFVFVDVVSSYRQIQIEQWYQSHVDNASGIWLDIDASSQLIINAPNLTSDERRIAFPHIAFSITKGNHKIIKHVIEEIGEESEK